MRPALGKTVWNCLPAKRVALYGFCPYLSPTVMKESVEKVLVSLRAGGGAGAVSSARAGRWATRPRGRAAARRCSAPVRAVHEHGIVEAGLIALLRLAHPHGAWAGG